MSSRFVSAGAIDPTTGEAAATQHPSSSTTPQLDNRQQSVGDAKKPNDEWLAVEKELAAERRRREEQRAAVASSGEKSLYEILQANKEAKQAAFEEANKIKNQFRALDDDEIDFLDEVKAKQRAEEERVRKETEEGLEAFRAAQQRNGQNGEGVEQEGQEDWVASTSGRKRKREKDKSKTMPIVKKRTTSEGGGKETPSKAVEEKTVVSLDPGKVEGPLKVDAKASGKPASAVKPKMGLVSYDSDEDDD